MRNKAAQPWLSGLLLLCPFALVGFVPTAAIHLKCPAVIQLPGFEPRQPVFMLDGEIIDPQPRIQADLGRLDPHSLEILCWDPETGAFGRSPGVSVVYMLTKDAVTAARLPVERLLEAQDQHFDEHLEYAQTLDQLPDLDLSGYIPPLLTASSTGWSAATPPGDHPYRCFVFSGDAGPPTSDMIERQISCDHDRTKASHELRERYEQGAG